MSRFVYSLGTDFTFIVCDVAQILFSRCHWDPLARALVKERCESASWSGPASALVVDDASSFGCVPPTIVSSAWISALTRSHYNIDIFRNL